MKKMQTTAILLVTLLLAGTTFSAQRYWNGQGSTETPPNLDFSAATNWFDGLAPVSGDDVTLRGQYAAAYDAHAIMTNSWSLNNIRIGGIGSASTEGTPTLTLDSGANLTWANSLDVGYSLVGDTNAAYGMFEINAGVHDGVLLNVAKAAGTSPWATTGEVTIANATLNLTGITKLATRDGSATGATVGTLTLNTGAVVNASNSSGAFTMLVGDFGTGKLVINGGTLNFAAGKALRLGQNGGDGTVELNSGLLNLGVEPAVGSGTGLIDIKKGLLMISDGAWRKTQIETLINNGNITASGGVSLAEDAVYSALYTAGTGSTNISTYITLKWGITPNAAAPRTNAMWAVDTTPPAGTRLTIGYEGDGWPGGYHPTLTTLISIDGAGAVSSSNALITASLSGNPLPTNLYNTSFIYDVNGQSDLNEVTGLGASPAGLSIAAANDSLVTGSGIRNAAGDTALITHELDPSNLPAGYDIELWEIETRILGAAEVATFIDLVNPTNRLSVAGDANTLQPNDVTGLGIAVDSANENTPFVSMCALSTDAATSYRLQTLTLNIVEQTGEPPVVEPYDSWMAPYTNTLSEAEQAKDADPDEDGLENLMEFALGGNPTTNDAASIQPTSSLVGPDLEYLYNRRTNHIALGLSYYLELTPDLVNTAFTNDTSAYTVMGTSPPSGEFETVTNSISTTNDAAKFVTLTVED